jgi:hypothetical protein
MPIVCVTGYSQPVDSDADRFVRLLDATPDMTALFQFWNMPHGQHSYAQARERFALSDAIVVIGDRTWFQTSHAAAEMALFDGIAGFMGVPPLRPPAHVFYFLVDPPAEPHYSSLQDFPGSRPNHRILPGDPSAAAADIANFLGAY